MWLNYNFSEKDLCCVFGVQSQYLRQYLSKQSLTNLDTLLSKNVSTKKTRNYFVLIFSTIAFIMTVKKHNYSLRNLKCLLFFFTNKSKF